MPLTLPSFRKLQVLTSHPATRQRPLRVLGRVAQWEILRAMKGLVSLPFDGDSELLVASNDGSGRLLYYFGAYEGHIFRVLEPMLPDCRLFVDVGANVGMLSIFAAKRLSREGRVVAFEPNPDAARRFRYNLDGRANVELQICGVGARDEVLHFRVGSNTAEGGIVAAANAEGSFAVQMRALDDLFPDGIDILKIDVEGHELEVLRGATRLLAANRIRALVLETAYLSDKGLFMDLLGQHGYRMFDVTGDGLVAIDTPSAIGHDTFAFAPSEEKLLSMAFSQEKGSRRSTETRQSAVAAVPKPERRTAEIVGRE